jgi:hypothetical protein
MCHALGRHVLVMLSMSKARASLSPTHGHSFNAGIVDQLVNRWGVAGVYLDQLAAGGPTPDWDPSHVHTLGGGAYWRSGIVGMLEAVRRAVPANTPLLTESNAEAYMDAIGVYLTLVAFLPPFAGPGARFVPAFPAIYGGYFVGAGSIFGANDFLQSDVLAAKMAVSLVHGIQIGWFSLGGVTSGPDFDRSCGPMGTFDNWMNPANAGMVAYLRTLVSMRSFIVDYFLDGRAFPAPALNPPPRTFVANASLPVHNPGPFPTLTAAVWRTDATQRLLAVFASVTASPERTTATLVMSDYGFPSTTLNFRVTAITPTGARSIVGTFTTGRVQIAVALSGRDAIAYEIASY